MSDSAISSFCWALLVYFRIQRRFLCGHSWPWKCWPFNSCKVRPNSIEKVAVGCSSSNIESKEKFVLVRGLIAVGLSAYRGFYTSSLREVSFEIQKVLELLVLQINAKIQAGKDRYQYIRLLSQLAYMGDMVNSWACSCTTKCLYRH